jgi:multidrug efflux pump subunit AcrB
VNKMTDFSMKNIAAIMIMMFLLVAYGTYSAVNLKVESMPDISFPVVMVQTMYPAPPRDVVDEVTKPLEKAISGLEGLKNMQSSSSDNFSMIVLELEQSRDPEEAKKDVESLLANVRLPSNAEKPKVLTYGFSSEPVYYMSLYTENGMNRSELNRLLEDVFKPGFEAIKGIDRVDAIGDQETTLDIKLNADAINNFGLTPASVSQVLKGQLISSPAGVVDFNGNTQMIRVRSEFDTIYNLENMQLTTPYGMVLLKDIATIEAINEAKFISRMNGKNAIALHLFKTKEANIVEFADSADKLIEQWNKDYPNVKFEIVLNGATEIKHSIRGMVQEGLLGAVLASLMILMFLRNLRMTMIVLVSIPLSILITLVFMNALGITLNIMTLGGMAIAVGRVVDDSIVVIENIYSRLEKAHERHESIIKLATEQVSRAITSSTITTVAVFGPIGMVSGVVGEVFRPFALTIVCALMASLLVALTVIPMLAKMMVLKSDKIKFQEESHNTPFMQKYRALLVWCLDHRGRTLGLAAVIFVASFFIVPFLNVAFMPASDASKTVFYSVTMPRETSLEAMDAKIHEIENKLNALKDKNGNPVYTKLESLIGYDFSTDQFPYKAHILAEVNQEASAKVTVNAHKELIIAELPAAAKVSGQVISFGAPEQGSGYTYSLKGEDLLTLQQAAAIVKEKMLQFPELSNVKDSLQDSKTEIEVLVDQQKARLYGLTTYQVLETVRSWVLEDKLGDKKFDNVTFETSIRMDPELINNIQKVSNLLIKTPSGTAVALKDVAKVNQVSAPVTINRDQQMQYVTVSAKIESADKGGVSNKVTAELAALELPNGVMRQVKGAADDIQKSFEEMFIAIFLSIFIVYFVMVVTFGNASAPFAILFSLPLAAIGGLLALLLTAEALSVTSLIGFLMLIGIVVTNAIVLVDRVQQLRDQEIPVREALIEAGMTRLRPIIMTAGATILALAPLALGMSEGAVISKGLAIVVIGGLLTSTLLTLVVVPSVYEMIESMKQRFANRRMKRKNKASKLSNPVIQ